MFRDYNGELLNAKIHKKKPYILYYSHMCSNRDFEVLHRFKGGIICNRNSGIAIAK